MELGPVAIACSAQEASQATDASHGGASGGHATDYGLAHVEGSLPSLASLLTNGFGATAAGTTTRRMDEAFAIGTSDHVAFLVSGLESTDS